MAVGLVVPAPEVGVAWAFYNRIDPGQAKEGLSPWSRPPGSGWLPELLA